MLETVLFLGNNFKNSMVEMEIALTKSGWHQAIKSIFNLKSSKNGFIAYSTAKKPCEKTNQYLEVHKPIADINDLPEVLRSNTFDNFQGDYYIQVNLNISEFQDLMLNYYEDNKESISDKLEFSMIEWFNILNKENPELNIKHEIISV